MSSELSRDEALAHFGVKGMRWGVRKDRAGQVNKLTGKPRKHANETESEKKERRKANLEAAVSLAVLGGTSAVVLAPIASSVARTLGEIGIHHMANLNNLMYAEQGARAAADFLADKGLTNYVTIIQDVTR